MMDVFASVTPQSGNPLADIGRRLGWD